MSKIKVIEQDIIFLSYDEPNAEKNYADLCAKVPWAKRVHGVKGSDHAHKAAAEQSDTDWFITVDADNIVDPKFFNLQLNLNDKNKDCVFRWKARNHINGLMYGNGGLSCWTKDFVNNMRTHENTDGRDETVVEFCFDPLYWPMYDCFSTTYPNGSAFHAWRAGFREGVKMCLNRGAKPTLAEFQQRVHQRNLDHLTIWHNIGADVEHGYWAMAGARQGTYMTMLTEWDHRQVQDFDALAELWKTVESTEPRLLAGRVAEELNTQLDLPMLVMEGEASRFFKHHYRSNWHNQGVMVREIDVIRRQEGW